MGLCTSNGYQVYLTLTRGFKEQKERLETIEKYAQHFLHAKTYIFIVSGWLTYISSRLKNSACPCFLYVLSLLWSKCIRLYKWYHGKNNDQSRKITNQQAAKEGRTWGSLARFTNGKNRGSWITDIKISFSRITRISKCDNLFNNLFLR